MKKSNKLVFFGTEDFSEVALSKLIDGGFNVSAVVTRPDTKAGRGQKTKSPKVAAVAKSADIKLLQPEIVADISDELEAIGAEAGVLAAYGKILPAKILQIFPSGIINIHPSILPKYRGPAPVEAAILNGDRVAGVSLIKLTDGMDEGPIYAAKKLDVALDDEGTSLNRKLADVGANLLVETLPDILAGALKPNAQDNSAATYTKLLTKNDGIIDWLKPAEDIERQIRAYSVWPRTRAEIFGQDVVITKARVADSPEDGSLVMECRPGYLEVTELIAPSGRGMSGADFIRGYKK